MMAALGVAPGVYTYLALNDDKSASASQAHTSTKHPRICAVLVDTFIPSFHKRYLCQSFSPPSSPSKETTLSNPASSSSSEHEQPLDFVVNSSDSSSSATEGTIYISSLVASFFGLSLENSSSFSSSSILTNPKPFLLFRHFTRVEHIQTAEAITLSLPSNPAQLKMAGKSKLKQSNLSKLIWNESMCSLIATCLQGVVVHLDSYLGIDWLNTPEILTISSISPIPHLLQQSSDKIFNFPAVFQINQETKISFIPNKPVIQKQLINCNNNPKKPNNPDIWLEESEGSENETKEDRVKLWRQNVRSECPGYDDVTNTLIDTIALSLPSNSPNNPNNPNNPDTSDKPDTYRTNYNIPKQFLITGLAGTGKTTLLKSISRHSGLSYDFISVPAIFSSREGETEDKLTQIFQKALKQSPSLIILGIYIYIYIYIY